MNDGSGGHQPGDDVPFVGDVNPLTLICNFAIHLVIFSWMGSYHDGILRKRFLQPGNDALEIFKNGQLMVSQAFGIFPAHAAGSASVLRLLAGVFSRFE